MATDDDLYKKALPLLQEADRRIRKHLTAALGKLGDPNLVRARIDQGRIKPLGAVKRKAKKNGWTMKETLSKASDLVGHRIVCNNLQDARRAADILVKSLEAQGTSVTRQEYVKDPKGRGYRAVHLDIRLPVEHGTMKLEAGCEIQIRTLLQDAWARLSRADVYTTEEQLSPGLITQMERLSDLLKVADEIAEDIRGEVSKPRKGEGFSSGALLSESSIAFLFHAAFGHDPSDYLVQEILLEFGVARIRADGLEAALKDRGLLSKLTAAYGSAAGLDPDETQIFRWAVHAAAHGVDSALLRAQEEGREEAEARLASRDLILGDLPEDWEELAHFFEHPGKDEDPEHFIGQLAEALGAAGECGICGNLLVQADTLAQELVDHYELRGRVADEARERLEAAIIDSGVDTGGWNNFGLCSYHDEQMMKDD